MSVLIHPGHIDPKRSQEESAGPPKANESRFTSYLNAVTFNVTGHLASILAPGIWLRNLKVNSKPQRNNGFL